MVQKIVRYTIRSEAREIVEQAIREFVASIAAAEPDTSYTSFRTSDPDAYIHVMRFPDEQAEARHGTSDHTTGFVAVLYPNCVVPPVFNDLTTIASTEQS